MNRQDDESERRVIRISIESPDPLTGTASAEDGQELRFEGWLALLNALSRLACPADRRPPTDTNHTWRSTCGTRDES